MMVKNLTEFMFKSYYKIIGYTKKRQAVIR